VALHLAVSGAAFLSLPVVAQGIYRWVDANGTTHYTTTPPPAGQAREVRELPRGAPSGSSDAGVKAPSSWQEKELEFRRRRLETDTREEQRLTAEKHRAAGRREACLVARDRLEVLQGGRPVYRLDEKGERVYLDDADRGAAIEASKRGILEFCN